MSHFAVMEVDIDQKFEKEFIAALEEKFGEGHVELHEEGASLHGFQGDDRSQVSRKSKDWAPPCEIVIRKKHVGGASNDVGYKRAENGKYLAYVSDYDRGGNYTLEDQHAVAQSYGVRVTEKVLKADGWRVHTLKQPDGSVKVVGTNKQELKTW